MMKSITSKKYPAAISAITFTCVDVIGELSRVLADEILDGLRHAGHPPTFTPKLPLGGMLLSQHGCVRHPCQ